MSKRKNVIPALICLILILILSITLFNAHAEYVHLDEVTTIQVTPITTQSSTGQIFTINMTVTDVTNLNAWQIHLLFNTNMLSCTEISVPSDNIFSPFTIEMFATEVNNAAGYILAFCALSGTFGVDGSGTLCQISFECKNPGITPLSIAGKMQMPTGSYLQDPDYNSIPFDTINGVIEISGSGFQKSTFTAIQNSETYPVIILSNSTITNFNYNETSKIMSFDASGTDGTIGLSSLIVSKELLNGALIVLADETALYPALYENQTHNFITTTYTHSIKNIKILLTVAGDVDGDRQVDMLDISIMIDAFMCGPGDPMWNPLADINRDDIVDMIDISIAIDNFMKPWDA
jgi:hypothetical protein